MSAVVAILLERAMKLIETEDKWTQGSFARDKDDESVDVEFDHIDMSAIACCCALGAVRVAARKFAKHHRDALIDLADAALEKAASVMGTKRGECEDESLAVILNDNNGHATVLSMYRAAIAAERGAQ